MNPQKKRIKNEYENEMRKLLMKYCDVFVKMTF